MNNRTVPVLTASLLLSLVGSVHAVPTGIPALVDLGDVNESFGVRIDGNDDGDYSGKSVAPLGDINGDGIDDFAISAPRANAQVGETYVIFGSRTSTPGAGIPAQLDGSNGFYIYGFANGDNCGMSVASAGDVNGDKINDLVVGAPFFNGVGGENSGAAFVIFGRKTSAAGEFPTAVLVSSLDGTNGFRLEGGSAGDYCGMSVSSAGDVNGDKISDIIIGAYGGNSGANDDAGKSYVVFGRKKNVAFPASTWLATLDGSNGFLISGINEEDQSGISVSSAGDLNNDKIGDVIIGARYAEPGSAVDVGETYVIFGSKQGFDATFDLSGLDGTNGFRIVGAGEFDYSGSAVACAGDLNGDKIDDILIGAYGVDQGDDQNVGAAYVVFGRKKNVAFPSSLDLSILDGVNGFKLVTNVEGDEVGSSVAAAGDVNGDKIADIIIGAPGGADGAGLSFVVFGRKTGTSGFFPSLFDLNSLNGSNGFVMQGAAEGDRGGNPVASAGDINADGLDDVIIAAPEATAGSDDFAGLTNVVFGPAPEINVSHGMIGILDGSIADLGSVSVGETLTANFTIENLGLADLTVQKPKAPKGFTFTDAPAATIAALGTDSFTLQITPTRAGEFTGKVTFTTNDASEKKFDFTVDWSVSGGDLASASMATRGPRTNVDQSADLNGDGVIDVADVARVLRSMDESAQDPAADANGDGVVNQDDLRAVLGQFGLSH